MDCFVIADRNVVFRTMIREFIYKTTNVSVIEIEEEEKVLPTLKDLNEKGYDIKGLFLSQYMREYDQFGLLKEIKYQNPFLPVIWTSANPNEAEVSEAVVIGVDEFMIKPIDEDKIRITVKRLLGGIEE